MQKTIYVYENWSGETPVKLGKLYMDQGRGSIEKMRPAFSACL